MTTTEKLYIEKLKEYINLLGNEVDDSAMFLHIHASDEIVEIGKKLREEIASLEQQVEAERNDFPEINFQKDIAEELSRDELIERLCEMHKSYTEMREEWFNKVHLQKEKTDEAKLKEELITYTIWYQEKVFGQNIIPIIDTYEEGVKEYLNQRKINEKPDNQSPQA